MLIKFEFNINYSKIHTLGQGIYKKLDLETY